MFVHHNLCYFQASLVKAWTCLSSSVGQQYWLWWSFDKSRHDSRSYAWYCTECLKEGKFFFTRKDSFYCFAVPRFGSDCNICIVSRFISIYGPTHYLQLMHVVCVQSMWVHESVLLYLILDVKIMWTEHAYFKLIDLQTFSIHVDSFQSWTKYLGQCTCSNFFSVFAWHHNVILLCNMCFLSAVSEGPVFITFLMLKYTSSSSSGLRMFKCLA